MTKNELLYDLMLIVNDDLDNETRPLAQHIAEVFENITGQDLPESGYMIEEMTHEAIPVSDINTLSKLVSEYWMVRNG